jgi:hypothetical protein
VPPKRGDSIVGRLRYQFGSLELVKGAKQDIWTFRYYVPGTDGKRQYRRIRSDTKEQYPNETAALRAVEALRLSVNSGKLLAMKNANQVFTLFALSNLFLLRRRLLVTQGA